MLSRLSTMFKARPRTWVSFTLMLLVGALLPGAVTWGHRIVLAWDAGAILYLALVLHLALRETPDDLRHRAENDDDGAGLILFMTCAAAMVSLGAIAYEAATASEHDNSAARLAVGGATIVLSWLMVQSSFAVHYAHMHYDSVLNENRPGLRFPSARDDGEDAYEPDYWDFFYFAANLGAASQTSDVMIVSRRLRHLALAHTLLSFLFNTMILSLGVNLAASVISG
jgi:uncharacterized membrane protein